MHSYKMIITRAQLEALDKFIKELTKIPNTNTDEKLLIAVLAQIAVHTDSKLGMFKPIAKSYQIKLNTAQMYAMVILSTDYVPDVQSYLGNFLNTHSNKILQRIAC